MAATELIERRNQPGRWLFAVAAFPALAFAIVGIAYGAFFLYAPIAAVCLIQIFYPMLLGWAAVAFVAWAAFLSYSYLAVVDLAKVANGAQPSVFLNESDTFGFLVLLLILGTVAVGLSIHRPLKHPANGRADA